MEANMQDIQDSIFLITDIQEKLLNAVFNKDLLKNKAIILVKAASVLNIPIFVTEQYPKGLGSTIPEIKTILQKNSVIQEKTDFNAFENKSFFEKFNNLDKKQIIIMGIETHVCVYQTAEYLLKNGFNVTLAADACGSRSKDEHNCGIDNLKQKGADIKSTEMILFELLKTAKHPNFKEIQSLIK